MKLPGADRSLVARQKIVEYLLNAAHPKGASKAKFFAGFGFHVDKWQQLAEALRRHGQAHRAKRMRETGYGPRFEAEGKLDTPDGRSPRVLSVWQLERGPHFLFC
ncbi:MAG: DUF6883 domain-containing protein [Limisphaerales bacterium]